MRHPRGSILLEVVVATGVAAMFMSALVALVLAANSASDRSVQTQKALWSMQDGLEALRTLAYSNLTTTDTGSLTLASGKWSLGTSGPAVLGNGMTQTIKVQSVARDSSCAIVSSGGTTDPDSKTLESDVTWTDTAGRSHTVTEKMLRTNWSNPTGSCWVATTQAGQASFSFSTSEFYGGKQLRNVFLTNTGGTAITIDKIVLTWDYPTQFQQLFIDSTKAWSSSGPGSPSGDQNSGTTIDLQDFTVAPGQTVQFNKGQFTGAMSGATISIELIYSDGSSYQSPTFNPT